MCHTSWEVVTDTVEKITFSLAITPLIFYKDIGIHRENKIAWLCNEAAPSHLKIQNPVLRKAEALKEKIRALGIDTNVVTTHTRHGLLTVTHWLPPVFVLTSRNARPQYLDPKRAYCYQPHPHVSSQPNHQFANINRKRAN